MARSADGGWQLHVLDASALPVHVACDGIVRQPWALDQARADGASKDRQPQ
eukprot:CAMPEP_0183555210 /NCGR_PEP_ID=MMETSP0371-20130417/79346_1 /TAXON_ID=268820 /ORGANISM="Peridinium aciculiferum, Strain PAER-2" /LENGTH=50 /DNA_ID=CAMNT_0025761343 /DNA_START=345 /DNA_END=497 /DNA_ORIENTATION=-